MYQLTIRPANLNDLPTLLAFEQGIISAERPFDATLNDGNIHYYNLKKLIQSEEAEVVVAEATDNQLAGSGFAEIRPAKPYLKFKAYAYLGFMYTIPEYRGKGINQKITEALIKWSLSKGIDELRLDVYSDNIAAIKAYEKAGFTKNLVEMRMEIER